MSQRKSSRRNFGKKPEHLKDFHCDDTDDEDTSSQSNEDLDMTVMPGDEDPKTAEQTTEELLRQLVLQMGELHSEVNKLKTQQLSVGAGTSTEKPPELLTTQQNAQTAILNANASPFTVPSQLALVQDYRRPLHDLPIFDGSIEQWPKFYQTYLVTTETYKYTKLENLVRLEKALRGKAKESVEAMLIHADSVDDAINRLKFLFGDTESLIKSQIGKIREMPSIPDHKLDQMINFSTKLENLKTFMINGGCEKYLTNPLLIEELLLKLSIVKRIEWMQYRDSLQTEPTLVEFCDWVTKAARYATMVNRSGLVVSSTKVEKKEERKPLRGQTFHTKHANSSSSKFNSSSTNAVKCCEEHHSHHLSKCDEFSRKSNDDKWIFVKDNNLCFCCLNHGHPIRFCRSRKDCGVNYCKKKHHELLHLTDDDGRPAQVNTTKISSPQQVLFKVLPITIHTNGKSAETFAFIDEGSSASLIDEDLASSLGLTGEKEKLTRLWMNDCEVTLVSTRVSLEISGEGCKQKKFLLQNVQTVKNINLPIQSLDISKLGDQYKVIKALPIAKYDKAVPKVLIGLNNIHVGLQSQQKVGGDSGPIAIRTKLGWLVYGSFSHSEPASDRQLTGVVRVLTVKEANVWDDIHQQMKDYFSTESFGSQPKVIKESADDIRANELLHSTTKKISTGYETGLLWSQDIIKLPESSATAIHRLKLVERRMLKDPEYAKLYTEGMDRFIEKGYAIKLKKDEAAITSPSTWYLPHFGVKNPAKPNKLRIVFDAASKSNGVSLNDKLLTGPDFYENLLAIMYRFREGKIAVCADIREMFLQIQITSRDQDSQRFYWRAGNQNIAPEEYKMVSMIFGAKCSPASAQFVKNSHADRFPQFPEAIQAIKLNHYMDDFIQSFTSVEEAVTTSQQVVQIHKSAGFELRNFVSNCSQVLEQLDHKAAEGMCESLHKVDKILGMYWDSCEDSFLFELKFHKVDPKIISGMRCPTKRELLSIVMSIYDPIGFLGDFCIYVKILLQELWRLNIAWDQQLPNELETKWMSWLKEMQNVQYLRIPRCYNPDITPETNIELHLFVDASEKAFSSVAYFRMTQQSFSTVSFVSSKTRCAPLKYVTVPRKELQAAVLGARLKATILESHTMTISRIIFWSDSKTVLSWIQSDHRKYKPFVAHRVSEILDHSETSDWRWVPSTMNVADDATRDIHPSKFDSSSRWIKGPAWLANEENWPEFSNNFEDTCEEKRLTVLTANVSGSFDFSKYSTHSRMRRVYTWVLRWLSNYKAKKLSNEGKKYLGSVLTATELIDGEHRLCRIAQRESFQEELRQLESNKPLNAGSRIFKLTPYIDSEGLLRVSGRVDNSSILPISAKRPIILDSKHQLAKLIISHYHEFLNHINEDTVICEIRNKFWIDNLRQGVRRAKRECMHCKVESAKPVQQIMGQLPIDRLTPYVRPFTFTGLDYFGPVNITIGRRQEKRWIALFTCLTIRAVHLEIAKDLSADQCILCLRNFINIRGVPSRIRSDNGTNLVGARNELINAATLFNDDRVRDAMENRGIEWKYICPANPTEGGCWERMVQSVKRVLRKILKECAPREETLRSFLLEAANVVNSRPLTHLPVDSKDAEPLTPNHFLLGEPSGIQGPGPLDEKIWTLRKQWRISQTLKNHFWKRWIDDYLPTLTRRTRWCKQQKSLQVGDLVLICDNNVPRNEWRRGIVTEIFPDRNKVVRTAEVTTNHGKSKRPVSKLAVLDVKSECLDQETSLEVGMSSIKEV